MKPWIIALRLRTLPLAFSGWLVGVTLASTKVTINESVALCTLLTAFLLQLLSNLANDYGDAVSGVDSDKRDGPLRMVHSGHITKKAMRNAIVLFVLLSLVSGCCLLYQVFSNDFLQAFVFLLIGLIGIAAAIKYTVGKNPYGYAGFGDLFVFLFFGLILVFGTYYLQALSWDWYALLPAASIGLLSIGVLNVNNIRDIESDKLSGKNSIPVRIGREKAVIYHAVLLIGAVGSSLIYTLKNLNTWHQLLYLIALVFFLINIRAVAKKPLKELDPFLKQMALATLLFAILFSLGTGLSLNS